MSGKTKEPRGIRSCPPVVAYVIPLFTNQLLYNCAFLANEVMRSGGLCIQAITKRTMSTKLLDSSNKENSNRDPINSLL